MIPNSFPRTQGALSKEQYLLLLLLALLDQAGGELHISVQSLEKVDAGGKLLVDWDSDAQQCILRAGSSGLVVAEIKGAGWTQITPTQQPQPSQPSSHHAVIDDARVMEYLEKWWQKNRMREWREQGADAVGNMPPPERE